MASFATEFIDHLVVGQLDVILGANIGNITGNNIIVSNIDTANVGGNLNIGTQNAGNIQIGGANTSMTILEGNIVGTTNPKFGINIGGNVASEVGGVIGIAVYDDSSIVAGMFLGNCEGNALGTKDAWLFEVPDGNVYGINQDVCIDSNVEFGHAIFTRDALPSDIPPTSTYGVSAATFMSVHSGVLPDPNLWTKRTIITADPADDPGLVISEANVAGDIHEWQVVTTVDGDHLDLDFRYDGTNCVVFHGGNCDADFMGNVNIFGNINANIVPLLPDPLVIGNLVVNHDANVNGNLTAGGGNVYITDPATGDQFDLRAVPVSTYPDTMGGGTFSEALQIIDQDGDILQEMYRNTNFVRFPTGTIIGTTSGSLTSDAAGNLNIDSTANVNIIPNMVAEHDLTVLGNLFAPNVVFDNLVLSNLTVNNNTNLGNTNSSLTTITGNLIAQNDTGTQFLNINPVTGNIVIGSPTGNVFIRGNLEWVQSNNVQITDNIIQLNFSNSSVSADGAGIQIQDGLNLDAAFIKVFTSTTPDEWRLGVPDGGVYRINQSLATDDNVTFASVTANIFNVANINANIITANIANIGIINSNVITSNLFIGNTANIANINANIITANIFNVANLNANVITANLFIGNTANIAGNVSANLMITSDLLLNGYSAQVPGYTQDSYTHVYRANSTTAVGSMTVLTDNSYYVELNAVGRSGVNSMIARQVYHIQDFGGSIVLSLMDDNYNYIGLAGTISALSGVGSVSFAATVSANWAVRYNITHAAQ